MFGLLRSPVARVGAAKSRGLRRVWAAALSLGLVVALPLVATAGPDPAKLKAAAESFEAGASAFKDKKYEEAATHFEAADEDVPSAKTLRLSIRARSEAGQGSRAATLAALALDLYGGDDETTKLAKETIAKFSPKLVQVKIACASPCILATGEHIVHGEAATRWTIYVDPGAPVTIGASFFGNIDAKPQNVNGSAGGNASLRFEPPKDAPIPPTPTGSGGSTEPPPATTSSTSPETTGAGGDTTSGSEVPPDATPKKPFGIHPAFFITGLIVTAGLGGTTIWSGIDTKNNPGVDKVKADCKGQGTSCPTYQEGLSHQLRTNVLIGVTSVVGATTVVLAIVTNWKGKPKTEDAPKPDDGASGPTSWLRVTDVLPYVDAAPSLSDAPLGATSSGFVAGAQGRF